jgi:general secretion pathway protein F
MKARKVAELAAELARCVESGAPILDGVKPISPLAAFRLEQGHALAAALEGIAPPEAVPLLASGDAPTLRLVESQWLERARLAEGFRRVASLLAFQFLIGGVALSAVFGVLQFAELLSGLYRSLGMGIPDLTRALLWLAEHPGLVAAVVIGVPALGFFLLWLLSRLPTVAGWIYWIPAWGPAVRNRELFSLCSILSAELGRGTGLSEAMSLAASRAGNARMREDARTAAERLREGIALSASIADGRSFPATLVWATGLSERRGDLPDTLRSFASLYARDAERALKTVQGALPLLGILFFGAFVAGCAAALIAPVYGLLTGLSFRGGGSGFSFDIAFLFVAFSVLLGLMTAVYLLHARRRNATATLLDHLSAAAERGLPLQPAVEPLAKDTSALFESDLARVERGLSEGMGLAEALERAEAGLTPEVVAAVRAGEAAGNAGPALVEASRFVRKKRESVPATPMALFAYQIVLALVACLAAHVILPKMSTVLTESGLGPPPLPWDFVAASSSGSLILLLTAGFLGLAPLFRTPPRSPTVGIRGLFMLPLYVSLLILYAFLAPVRWVEPRLTGLLPTRRLERIRGWLSTMSVLLRSGMGAVEAARVTSRNDIERSLSEGRGLAESLERARFPSDVVWIVRAGERGDRLPAALSQAAELLDLRIRNLYRLLGRSALGVAMLVNAALIASLGYFAFLPLMKVSEKVLW